MTCTELGLVHGDIIEIDGVHDKTVAENFRLPPNTKAIILTNDDYFRYMPSYLCGDPTHLAVVTEYREPFNIMILAKKKVSWRKIRHTEPVLKSDSF